MVNISIKEGLSFEKEFKNLCLMQDIVCIRIPDGSKVVRSRNYNLGKYTILKTKSPFDFFITKEGKSCALDCKFVSTKHFNYARINKNQLSHLMQCSKSINAGYLVKFKYLDYYIFYNSYVLGRVEEKCSITPAEGKVIEPTKLDDLLIQERQFH